MAQSSRSILITGCSTGIGYHCAHAMKHRGWQVFASVRNDADKQRLESEGLTTVLLDYTDSASIAACAAQVLEATGGKLDALFNNGAYGQIGAVEDLSTDVLRAQFEANFFGWHDLTQKLLPAMREAGHGRIVQCSSILGIISMKYRGAYSSSKFALESLSDTLRMELDGTGIYVSLIEPGPIKSRFVARTIEVFDETIDQKNSQYKQDYNARMLKMKSGGTSRFKLGADAVQKRLVHAVEHKNPRPRYYVTTPTYVMGALKRILTHRAMDRFLIKRSNDELK
ncbi:MAG: short-chain dehydrogenase [Hyphomicrobiales bacterium]|nr:SDR family oxidoreductase [Hyphomicrobiales bacterium]PCJ84014.1 MAG: short-chain dehydrogenase [Hyphomicrobiales bacterium]